MKGMHCFLSKEKRFVHPHHIRAKTLYRFYEFAIDALSEGTKRIALAQPIQRATLRPETGYIERTGVLP